MVHNRTKWEDLPHPGALFIHCTIHQHYVGNLLHTETSCVCGEHYWAHALNYRQFRAFLDKLIALSHSS